MSERLWNILLDSFWKIFLPGLKVTIPLTVISFSIALVIATAMAMVQFANIKGLRQIARFYIWIFRGTPLLVQLFVVFYGLPRAGILIDPFPAAVLVFSLNEGAYSAETMRAALESGRPARSRLLCRHVVSADHAENYPSAGDAHRVPAAFQLSDRHGKGYFPCRKYHRNGDVYGNAADCSAHP